MTRKEEIININISIKNAIVQKNEIVLNTKTHDKDKQKARNQFSGLGKLPRCSGFLDYWCKLNCINGLWF